MRRVFRFLAGSALVWGAVACANQGGGTIDDPDFVAPGLNPDQGESIPTVRFYQTAEENWREGERRFDKKAYLAAQQFFAYIRAKFPYSRFVPLADIRMADCQFEREHYLEAIDSYRNFARLHPTHELVPYSLFRIGMAHYEQIPGSWFLLPPAQEKDQTAVKEAALALGTYLQRYPEDQYTEEAEKIFREVQTRLMAHERYVADFYKRTRHYKGYVMRLLTMKKKFEGVALDAGLLLELAEGYAKLGEPDNVLATFYEMSEKFPDAPQLDERDKVLDQAQAQKDKNEGRDF